MTEIKLRDIPWLHVHAQAREHSSVLIIGTKGALFTLREAIDKALASGGEAEATVFATDGEGYAVQIVRTNKSVMGALPYTCRVVEQAMRYEREVDVRHEKLREASRRARSSASNP